MLLLAIWRAVHASERPHHTSPCVHVPMCACHDDFHRRPQKVGACAGNPYGGVVCLGTSS